MAIKDAEHPHQKETKKDHGPKNPMSVKNMSELGKLVSEMTGSHIPHTPNNPPQPIILSVAAHERQDPDFEVRDPILEPVSQASAPVNLVASLNPQPVNNSLNQGKSEMNTAALNTSATTAAIAAATGNPADQAMAAHGTAPAAAVPVQVFTKPAGVMETGNPVHVPSVTDIATSAAAASASTSATPNLGKVSRKVGLGIEALMYDPSEGEAALFNKFNGLVSGAIEVRDEVNVLSDRLTALENKRGITIAARETSWMEDVPKQIAIGAGIGLVTYAGIVLASMAIGAITESTTAE
jgi:hypothetical protein